jgi:hypothetical protein
MVSQLLMGATAFSSGPPNLRQLRERAGRCGGIRREARPWAGPQTEHPSPRRPRGSGTPWHEHRTAGLTKPISHRRVGARVGHPVIQDLSRVFRTAPSDASKVADTDPGAGGFRSCEPRSVHKPRSARAGFGFEPFCGPLPPGRPPAEVVGGPYLGCDDLQGGPPLPGHVPLCDPHLAGG